MSEAKKQKASAAQGVFLGKFERTPVQNGYHSGSIIITSDGDLSWKNAANRAWRLHPDTENIFTLFTGEDCPYKGKHFDLVWKKYGEFKEITAFNFGGECYDRPFAGLEGRYVHVPRGGKQNDFHRGSIVDAGDGAYTWTNASNVSWSLRPEGGESPSTLIPGKECPYKGMNFNLEWEAMGDVQGVKGFKFQGEFYQRVFAVPPDPSEIYTGGLHGYIQMGVQGLKEPHLFKGVSWYSAAWPLLDVKSTGFQCGLLGTWIIPENRDWPNDKPLCPPGTVSRDQWGGCGKHLFQTIEGGLGFWGGDNHRMLAPRYRINAVPDGYNRYITSPGCHQHNKASNIERGWGFAQVSNRLLLPPDGIPMHPDTCGELLGQAWMALPWTKEAMRHKKNDSDEGVPTGSQGWTLFFNTSNFVGPVGFFLPDLWSELSSGYREIVGRGIDARPGSAGSFAMEQNRSTHFESQVDGTTFTKIPNVRFPLDDTGRSVIARDVRVYTPTALWESFEKARNNHKLDIPCGDFGEGIISRCSVSGSMGLDQKIKDKVTRKVRDSSTLVKTAVQNGNDLVLEWGADSVAEAKARHAKSGGLQMATLPCYYRVEGNEMVPVTEGDVPRESGLIEKRFQEQRFHCKYAAPDNIEVAKRGYEGGPFTANLCDGSQVTYNWFRFIEQPALMVPLGHWTSTEKEELQALVERVQRKWCSESSARSFIPQLTDGSRKLIQWDEALLVEPPEGLSIGYVPVVLSQEEQRTM